MADNSDNGGLYFIVGALVVAVAVMGYFYMDGSLGTRSGSSGPSISIHKTEVVPDKAPVNFNLDIDRDGGRDNRR